MSARGRLIVLEGGEGAGKSTHLAGVAAWLESRGRRVVRTREPGGSPLAEAIRGLVLGDWPEGIDARTEALLIFAARAAHLHATIEPALARGDDVVCDRFVDASYAYQGLGRGLGVEVIGILERFTLGNLQADLVLVLDIDPELGLTRARHRGNTNRFEEEPLVFAQRVRQVYLDRAKAEPARYAVVDASLPKADVSRAIEDILIDHLAANPIETRR
jgi:dTMP kinase